MSAKPLSLLEVPETVAVFHRTLQDGSRLEYRMQVLQQPERARACGMGAKSHADRRPVDPPPVVELRLFQGTEKTDVTFSHNSNFFLFATLEQARPIAQGRGMPAPAPAPVLTGVPVSGMAYLDRPNPAGYFIFPDLSVRHEGKYRLRFALYEETKDEIFPIPSDSLEPREWATHRLDVKSKAFTVFSAKKFPGLAESTALSRIVAEQGCRVRIRRDVRMRRRSDRQGRDSEDRMDETAMLRAARRGATPDQYNMNESIRPQHDPQYHQPTPHPMQRTNSIGGRGRSGSDASVSSAVSEQIAQPQRYDNGYVTPGQNRSQFGPPSGPPQQSANHHLSFGAHSHAPPAPPQHPSQEIYGQISRPYSQPHAPVAQHHPSPHLAPSPRPQQSAYGPPPSAYQSRENSISMQGQQMQQPNGHNVRRESVDYRNNRRDSDPIYHQQQYRPNTPSVGPSYMENGYGHHQQQQQQQPYQAPPPQHYQPQSQAPPSSVSNNLPPLRLPALEPKWRSNQPTTPNSSAPPALQSPGIYPSQNGTIQQQRAPPPPHMAQPPAPPNPNQFPTYYPEQKYPSPPTPSSDSWQNSSSTKPDDRGTKRPWGRVFNNAHVEGSMQNHARPSTNSAVYGSEPSYAQIPTEADDDAYDLGKLKMSYRRADGVEIVRRLPGED
ncbi:velvet factor-domain-containing protein [Morchella snyderi]|nr:velvet factor-domain-containing protein [Morchella snyderi]